MTLQSPRIYTYKITFEEVPYYYYGVHKEKRYNEEYWGSPYTNKWCWELYTPKKQILQLFDFTDEGWLEAQSIERRLIRPFLNDTWCLNERCGSSFSLKVLRENGKKVGKISGQRHKENRTGVFGRSKEKMTEDGKKGTQIQKEMGTGVWGLTLEERMIMGKNGGKKGGGTMGKRHYENGTGIFSLSIEEKLKNCSKGGKKTYELGLGVHARTKEQMQEDSKKAGKKAYELGVGVHGRTKEKMTEDGKRGGKKSSSQRWECLVTGYISNAGGLFKYQKKRGIDPSRRKRIS